MADMKFYSGHFDRVRVGMGLRRDEGGKEWDEVAVVVRLVDQRPFESSFVLSGQIDGLNGIEVYYSGKGEEKEARLCLSFATVADAVGYVERLTRLHLAPEDEWSYASSWRTDPWTVDETGHNPVITTEVAYPTFKKEVSAS